MQEATELTCDDGAVAVEEPTEKSTVKGGTKRASGGARSKKPTLGTEDVDAMVENWFRSVNVPASTQSVADALQSKYSKTLLQGALDRLEANSKLAIKEIKKAKVYFAPQSTLACLSQTEMSELEGVIKGLEQQCSLIEAQNRNASALVARLQRTCSLDELKTQHDALQKEVEVLRQRSRKASVGGANREAIAAAITSASTTAIGVQRALQQRRALFHSIWDNIRASEGAFDAAREMGIDDSTDLETESQYLLGFNLRKRVVGKALG